MRILFKYASRGRPEKFFAGLQNIYSTTKTKDYLILCSFDLSDRTMNNDKIKAVLDGKPNLVYHYGQDEGKIGAINRDINQLNDSWDILINFSDDMKFSGFGWDEVLFKLIKHYWDDSLDCFIHLWDGLVPLETPLPTMTIIGREYYNRDGFVYHPSYKSFSSDAEAMYVALMRGCHKYILLKKKDRQYANRFIDHSLFTHQHPAWFGNSLYDNLYKENAKYGDQDTENYFNRMKNYFDEPKQCPGTINFNPNTGGALPIPSETYLLSEQTDRGGRLNGSGANPDPVR